MDSIVSACTISAMADDKGGADSLVMRACAKSTPSFERAGLPTTIRAKPRPTSIRMSANVYGHLFPRGNTGPIAEKVCLETIGRRSLEWCVGFADSGRAVVGPAT